ncbi:hypothetical protein Trydic_g10901 [Trypoxylus dichotomus]
MLPPHGQLFGLVSWVSIEKNEAASTSTSPPYRSTNFVYSSFDCDPSDASGLHRQVMDDNCTMRPCATDFSIAAIMSRHGRAKTRCRDRDPADNISPLGFKGHRISKEFYPWFHLYYLLVVPLELIEALTGTFAN